jgi:MoxR-like ATPase
LALHVGTLSILLDTTVLPEGAVPPNWRGGRMGGHFKVVPGTTWTNGPTAEVLARWDVLGPSYYSAIGKTISKGSIPPWWKHHESSAMILLREETSLPLPDPQQPDRPTAAPEDLQSLIEEFATSYTSSQEGRNHTKLNLDAIAAFTKSFAELRPRHEAGDDITSHVLTRLLPHSNKPNNLARGAWITAAPVFNTDIRKLIEPTGRAKPEDWPLVANLIMELFETCADHADKLGEACQQFVDRNPVRGIQGGALSPGLAILNPDAFAVINRKPLEVVQRFLGRKHTPKLLEYAAANEDVWQLIDQAREGLDGIPGLEGLPLNMRFDMFTHWLVAVRTPIKIRYWKIAPGEQAFNWDECRTNGFISMGWEDFGDLSIMSREEFDKRAAEKAAEDSKGYSEGGTSQLWTFAHGIRQGDRVLANKGLTRILGIGTVTGDYYFVPDVVHGHRVPVDWDEFTPTEVPKQGWHKTIVQMKKHDFDQLVGGQNASQPGGKSVGDLPPEGPSCWLFQANPKLFDLERKLQVEGADAVDAWKVAKFVDKMKSGDTVLLWQAGKKAGIYAVAELSGPVFEVTKETADDFVDIGGYKAPLRITTILDAPILKDVLLAQPELANLHILKAPFGTNFKVTADEWAAIRKLLEFAQPPEPVVPTVPEIAAQTGFPETELTRWINAIHRKGQAVLYGPPGTGKTYVADLLARHLAGTDGFVDLVQFHPAYTYEDFLQGLRPVLTPSGGLDYRLVPGRFLEFCAKASRRKGPCVLILDEINRANLARVFGELMYLLEYRNHTVPLAAGGELSIPQNVRIIGTMNTADRSIALVDHALRRRFAFIHLRPQYAVLEKFHQSNGYDGAALVKVLKRLNQAIDDPHYEVGISFFLNKNLGANLEDIWRMEIEPYLEEYFFDQAAKAKEFSWDKLKPELL